MILHVRAEPGERIEIGYRCPVHGPVNMEVIRGEEPDAMPCPLTSWSIAGLNDEYADRAAAEGACRARCIDLGEVRFETQRCAADMAIDQGSKPS